MKVRFPLASIEMSPWSAPPVIAQVTGSLAVSCPIAVTFSLTLKSKGALIVGGALAATMLRVTVAVEVRLV